MEPLPQLQPCSFQSVRVLTPVGPARGNRLDDGVQEGDLPQVLECLGVFVVLNAVADGLQTYSWGGFAGGDGTRRIEEYSITRPSEAVAAICGIHIVPTANGVPGGPSVRAVVQEARRSLRPIQEPRLDALVDRRIVDHPLRSVTESGVATRITPEVAPTDKRQGRPLFHGIQQHPVVNGTAPVPFIE